MTSEAGKPFRDYPWRIKAQVFFRALFIQAGFNPELMQTLGLLYALAPALRYLYPDPDAERAAVQRHLSTFNTHPYVAAAIVGGILHYEARVARHEASVEQVARFKATVMGPLAALGDGFFWLSLRPAIGALAIALVPAIGLWAVLVFVVLYNVVHLTARGWMFLVGLREGDGLVARLASARVPVQGERLRMLGAAGVGVVGAWLAVRFGTQVGGSSGAAFSVGCLSLGVLATMLARQVKPIVLLYGLAAVAMVIGALA